MNQYDMTIINIQEVTLLDLEGNQVAMGQALFGGQPILFDQDIKPWMSQADIAEMFGVSQPAVAQQLKRIASQDLLDESTHKDFLYVAQDGKTRKIRFYDMTIINIIGSRVQEATPQVVAFIKWAGNVLNQYTSNRYLSEIARLQDHNDHLRHAMHEERLLRLDAQRQMEGFENDYNHYLARARHELPIGNED